MHTSAKNGELLYFWTDSIEFLRKLIGDNVCVRLTATSHHPYGRIVILPVTEQMIEIFKEDDEKLQFLCPASLMNDLKH